MGRKKVKLAWITNDATRRTTFEKRKKGLVKKVSELATLCGVEACLVVYGPQDAVEAEPEVWPSPAETARVATRFNSMPEMYRWRKMTDQEDFLRQRVAKLQDQLRRQDRESRELEVSLFAHEIMAGGRILDDADLNDAMGLMQMIDLKLKQAFDQLQIDQSELLPMMTPLYDFTGNEVLSIVQTKLSISLGEGPLKRTRTTNFVVVNTPSGYNVILGRLALNEFRAVVFTYCQKIKFPVDDKVGGVKGDLLAIQRCYIEMVRSEARTAQKNPRLEVNTIIEKPPARVYEENEEF
ncbi:agamous-like MADS-box protein AGL80 [Zingiber officinale]|uniref:agamous-like MADS-box protein AGL80 n=1 Tax=Zingiber officinale TaxID=94328 RepID=UPI001C4C1E79|nr:agamous-like MADS-box protein AGL80 [Zingiber officinale]